MQSVTKLLEMDKNQFIEKLKFQLQTRCNLKDINYLDLLINLVTKERNVFTQQDIAETLQLTERIRLFKLCNNNKKFIQKLSAHDLISSDYLADKILPLIENIRIKIFNSSDPPFSSIEEAVDWIENFAAIKSEKEKKNRELALKGVKRLRKKTGQDIKIEDRCLHYLSKNNSIKAVPFDKNSPLAILEYESRKIEKASGFPQLMLTIYILTGITPFIPRTIISIHEKMFYLPNGDSLFRKEATINIRSPDLTSKELINIYRTFRKELNLVKNKPLNERDWRLYFILKKLKIPLESKKKKHWELALKMWNKAYPQQKYSSWQGLQKRSQRMKEKLEFN